MTKRYQKNEIDTPAGDGLLVPERVSVAMAEIAGSMREGLLALAVGTGRQVMQVLMEADVTAVAGPKGRHDPRRSAVRHGSERGSVTLGGRRVPVTRPRVRAADGTGELPVPTYELFTGTEILGSMAMERMLAGLSTRHYPIGLEPVGDQVTASARSTSKSAVSRKFVAMTETALAQLLAADLSGLDLVALMVDGVHFGESCCVVALGIDADGIKHPLALVQGATENATVVTDLLTGLRDRGLDVTRPILVGADHSDAAVGVALLAADDSITGLVEAFGDSAYGTGEALAALESAGHTAVIKPRSLRPTVPGGFTLDDFAIDEDAAVATCPAGITRPISRTRQVTFGAACRGCPLRARCTTAAGGRTLKLHPHDAILRAHRARWRADPDLQARYRRHRPMVERSLAWVTRGNRRVPYRGVIKNDAWLHLRVAAVNLRRLLALGLTRGDQQWILLPA